MNQSVNLKFFDLFYQVEMMISFFHHIVQVIDLD